MQEEPLLRPFPGMVLTESRAREYLRKEIWSRETFLDIWEANVLHHGQMEHRDDFRTANYRQLWAECESVAAALYDLGVRKGTPVALQLPTGLDYVTALFAAARIGAPAVLLQTDLGPEAVRHSLDISQASVLITAGHYRGAPLADRALTLARELPSLRAVIVQGPEKTPLGALSFETLRTSGRTLPPSAAQKNRPNCLDPFVIVFTSGTTGSPKGVVQLHANYLWAARAYAKLYGLAAGEAMLDLAPICHQTGMLVGVTMPLVSGGRMLLMDRFSGARAFEWIEGEHPRYMVCAPPHVVHIAGHPALKSTDTSSVKILFYAGAPVAAPILRQLHQDTGWAVGGMFGWTEGFVATSTRLDDPVEAASETVGVPVPGIEVRLIDEEGRPVPPGKPGEMISRGPNFSAGYYRNPDASAKGWDEDGWFHSGDLFSQDAAGRYVFMGRADDIINRGGTKIDPKTVEDACAAHPAVQQSAIIGTPDPVLGQRTLACILLKEGASPFSLAELRDFLREQGLAEFQLPDRLTFVTALPTTHSGKIKKKELRERFAATGDKPSPQHLTEPRNGAPSR